MFHGAPSKHLWEDDPGTVHPRSKGGRRTRGCIGCPCCVPSMLRCRSCGPLLVFLDGAHVVVPCPTTTVYAALQEAMFNTSGHSHHPREDVTCCSELPRCDPERCGEDPTRFFRIGHTSGPSRSSQDEFAESAMFLGIPLPEDVQTSWSVQQHEATA